MDKPFFLSLNLTQTNSHDSLNKFSRPLLVLTILFAHALSAGNDFHVALTYRSMPGEDVDQNVVYNCPEVLRLTAPYATFDEANNLITGSDPGFVDEVRMNFELRDDSIVYKKIRGFEKIPFAKIGPYADKYRKN